MRLGLGLYKDSLTAENFSFAAQLGVTDLVVHLVDYFKGADPAISNGIENSGWGNCSTDELWTEEYLGGLVDKASAHGLHICAIENFSPKFWYDILLDGPEKERQLEDIKTLIKRIGNVGISCIGYNFSIAGVWGWQRQAIARGGAESVLFDEKLIDTTEAIPDGMVWNMQYKERLGAGTVAPINSAQIWQRLEDFLQNVLPTAERAGVDLAAHPDDPPMETLRQTARLLNQPYKYQRLFDLVDSPKNKAELCLGTVQEMSGGNIYATVELLAQQDKIGYIHFRNVRGKVPAYQEVFLDEGDIDMKRIINILQESNYKGVLIPDHTPDLLCKAPWHAGMAYALGYMRALI